MQALVVVAHGDVFVKDTEVMVNTFRIHHPTWQVLRFYNKDLDAILPKECLTWDPFSKCEIGRFCALQRALSTGYDHALYCDGDFMWCGQHVSSVSAPFVFTPHQILPEYRWADRERRFSDGVINIGLIEARRGCEEQLAIMIKRAVSDMKRYWRKGKLCLQFMADMMCVFEKKVELNLHPGANAASWNIGAERRVVGTVEHPVVIFQGYEWPLGSLHMSGSHRLRKRISTVMDALLDRYEALIR